MKKNSNNLFFLVRLRYSFFVRKTSNITIQKDVLKNSLVSIPGNDQITTDNKQNFDKNDFYLKGIKPGQFLRETKILSPLEVRETLEKGEIQLGKKEILSEINLHSLKKLQLNLSPSTIKNFLQRAKLFVFYKEKGFICYEKDPEKRNRPNVFEVLKHRLGINKVLFIIGRLDYNAEGLILFTDNADVCKAWNDNQDKFSYTYKIKAAGYFDDKVLSNIRKGAIIKGKKCGPFFCEAKRLLSSSNILLMKNNSADMRDIKLILQKNNLRMMKITRTHFGPYVIGNLAKGQLAAVDFETQFNKIYFDFKKELFRSKKEELEKKFHKIEEVKTLEDNVMALNPWVFSSLPSGDKKEF